MVHCPAMDNREALLWLFVSVLAVGLAGAAISAIVRVRKRHARRMYYRRAGQGAGRASAPAPLAAGIAAGQSADIRARAERAARRDWMARAEPTQNPYDAGTPEHVLWYATYQITVHELSEPPPTEGPADDGPPTEPGGPRS